MGDALTDRSDFARGFGADRQRQLALGEGHAAEAPDVDMVQADSLDADLHFAGTRRRGRRHVDDDELTIGNKIERTHEPRLRQERLISDGLRIAGSRHDVNRRGAANGAGEP
jgi:hypothetical protein